jgi:tetratricopeptide (TPR) repeat protein
MKRWKEGMKRLKVLLSRPVLCAGGTYVVVSLVCTQIPLLNYLGFEFSFVIALVSSFVSAFLTIRLLRPVYRQADPPKSFLLSYFPAFLAALAINVFLLSVPLAIILVNALFVRNCSIFEGLGFFVLLPVVSVWFSNCLGFFTLVHYRRSRTVVLLMMVASFIYAGALGYFTPAIYSYNFFYGFFPGLSYDELLTITLTLVLFRVITIALGGVLLWLTALLVGSTVASDSTWVKGKTLLREMFQVTRGPVTVTLMSAIGLLVLFRCELGFETTAGYIQKALGGKLQTSNFTIYYARNAYSPEEIQHLGSDHEYRFKQILTALGQTGAEPLTSYIYPSAAVKQRLIGTGTTNLAKPWSREIHLAKQSVDAALKHEMIHVMVGDFGLPVINASLSTGLVEGVAMALENKPGNRTLHEYSAAMRKFGVSPDIRRLMTPAGFFSQSSSVSYILAGSLCRYLVDQYGIGRLLEVYRAGVYERVYGVPLDTLVSQWSMMLDTIVVTERDRGVVDVFFRARPIFGKICPRVLARRTRAADRLFGERQYEQAYEAYEEIYREGKSMESFRGMIASHYRMSNYYALIGAVDPLVRSDEHPLRYLTLNILTGDALWALGDTASARQRYAALEYAELTEGYTETARIRQYMLDRPRSSPHFLSYFLSDRTDSARVPALDILLAITGDTALCRYLQGRVLFRSGKWETSIHALEKGMFVPEDSFLECLRQRTIGECFLRLGRFDEARTAFMVAHRFTRERQENIDLQEWIDRCDWMSRYIPS